MIRTINKSFSSKFIVLNDVMIKRVFFDKKFETDITFFMSFNIEFIFKKLNR